MHKIITGLIIGVVTGVLFGASVVAPRLQSSLTPADSSGSESVTQASREPLAFDTTNNGVVQTLNVESAYELETTLPGTILSRTRNHVRSLSDNAYGFSVQAPGTLTEENEMLDALRSGSVDAIFLSAGALADNNPTLSIFAGLPFGPPPMELIAWLQTAEGRKAWMDGSSTTELYAVPCGIDPGHFAGWSNKKIEAVEDLSGLKIQTKGISADIYERLGAEIIQHPETAIINALNGGTVDAVVAASPWNDQTHGLYKNIRYLYVPGWQQSAELYILLLRNGFWETLPMQFRSILESACRDNMLFSVSEGEKRQFETLKTLATGGMEIQRLHPDILSAARAIWEDMADAQVKEDDLFSNHWQALQVFRDNYEIREDLNAH